MQASDFCVLLAEDDPIFRYAASRVLASTGYTVLSARDGSEALALAAECSRPIHLLITDLTLPKLDGAAVARTLKSRHPDLAVVFMSGADASAVPADVRAYARCFSKPVSNDRIRSEAARAYARHRSSCTGGR
jgi:two-component system, cell cycle sensor histidine kinase and response regulator CckA